MKHSKFLLGVIFAVLVCTIVAQNDVQDGEEEPVTLDADTGTFESFGTVGDVVTPGSKATDDEVATYGDGYKLTEMVCEGGKCRKASKKDMESRSKRSTPKRSATQIKFDTVRRILQTNPDADMYATLSQEGVPTVVQNSVLLSKWSAFTDWSFDYFIDLWTPHHAMSPILVSNSSLPGFKETIVPFFNFSRDSAWPHVPKPYYETAMNLGTFFSGQCSKESPESWWWMKPFPALKDEHVESDTSYVDFFIDQSVTNKTTPILSLVTGSRAASMQLHYDQDDTFIVQVFRRQQVLLFSPQQMRQLYLYPYTHPHRRRSQVMPLTSTTELNWPGIGSIRGIEAMLDAGDVLYIPRYWGYHVVNLDPGISVHVTSPIVDSRGSDVWSLKNHLINLEHLDPMKRVTAAKMALQRVVEPLINEMREKQKAAQEGSTIDKFAKPQDPSTFDRKVFKNFLKQHAKQRYGKLPNYKQPGEMTKKEIFQLVKVHCREARLPDNKLEPIDNMKLAMRLEGTKEAWSQIPDDDVRMTMLGDWIDFIAWQAYGKHEYAEAFIRRCF